MYEEQTGCVKLAGKKSSSFRITNGTRQGSVLSPALFSVYLDDLIQKLRNLGLGCHVGGWWMGACGYADDLILLAPLRSVLQEMVKVCQEYGEEHNLVFSTDPNPTKSKTKCIYFCGRMKNVKYPAPVQLYNKELPWVVSADHLGHTLHQMVNMDQDCKIKRAKFIDKTVGLRDQLSFAKPEQVIKAAEVYCCDGYGSMLWELESDTAEQYFKAWNTFVKLTFEVPRSTFTYLVEGFLAKDFVSLRNQILGRYPSFFQKLLKSPSKEIRLLANIVGRDPRSTTYKNLQHVKNLSSLDPWDFSSQRIKIQLPVKKVPENQKWRLGLMANLMEIREDKFVNAEDASRICAMLDSLCST